MNAVKICAREYRASFHAARSTGCQSRELDMLGQPPHNAVYQRTANYAYWIVPKTCGTVQLGGVFRTLLSGTRNLSSVLTALRMQGFRHIKIDAFRNVAEKVWIPLGFREYGRAPFDWAHAPLHMDPRRAEGQPVLFMSKVL